MLLPDLRKIPEERSASRLRQQSMKWVGVLHRASCTGSVAAAILPPKFFAQEKEGALGAAQIELLDGVWETRVQNAGRGHNTRGSLAGSSTTEQLVPHAEGAAALEVPSQASASLMSLVPNVCALATATGSRVCKPHGASQI